MAEKKRTQTLPTVTAENFRLDRQGRVVITDPALADRIKEIGDLQPDPGAELAGNGVCCGNTGCLSEQLVGLFESLVARTRPR